MEQRGQLAAAELIKSLTGWWQLAGVDSHVGNEPVQWLGEQHNAPSPPLPSARSLEKPAVKAAAAAVQWPDNMASLRSLVASGGALPCNDFGSKAVAAAGPDVSEVMIVSDLPDREDVDGGKLGSGASGALLSRMLAAIGLALPDCYWTALAMTRPATGEIAESALPDLAAFVRHQVGLVKPTSLVLLGSAPCKALLGEELMSARLRLPDFNHEGRIMPVLATFHPRTLIARPAMKAQAWKDLQMFARKAAI